MAVPTRIDVNLDFSSSSWNNRGDAKVEYIVETINGSVYIFYINTDSKLVYKKSTDYGYTFASPVTILNALCAQVSVWFDYWTDPTGVMGGLIHIAYQKYTDNDIAYKNIDTNNSDTLSGEVIIFNGASKADGGALSISRMIGGNIICIGCIDDGVEIFNKKSVNVGANWTDISAAYEATLDIIIIMPGWGADNQDAMAFYYDNSATEVSVKYYDDSGDSWSETSLATSISLPSPKTTNGHISAVVNHAASNNLVCFWTAIDAGNADLRVFSCSQSAQTETAANCVLNSTDDQGFCAISIYNSNWYIAYFGKSDGVDNYNTALRLYRKYSSNGGTAWSSEENLTPVKYATKILFCNPIAYKNIYYFFNDDTSTNITINKNLNTPRSTFQLGQ